MSGSGTFSGTNYQGAVIAYVYVHMLAQAPLGWLTPARDIPLGVSGETNGPGDDLEIEFGDSHAPVEVQAKHGLTAGGKLSKAIDAIRTRTQKDAVTKVIFAVDRSSSRTVYEDFAKDLDRFRTGRTDHLKSEIQRIVTELGNQSELLKRIFLIPLDLDDEHNLELKFVFHSLQMVVEDRSQVRNAWAVLLKDAATICAKRLRRTRKDLVDLLAGTGIKVRPPNADERFMLQLDLTKRLLDEDQGEVVLTILNTIYAEIGDAKVNADVFYRLEQHRAAAFLNLAQNDEALNAARRALDFNPLGVPALLVAGQAAASSGDHESARTYIDRAIELDPTNATAWGAKAQICAIRGEPLPLPRDSIVETDSYQLSLAQIASNAAEWGRVIDITTLLLARKTPDPQSVILRIQALLSLAEDDEIASAREKRIEAERLATSLVNTLRVENPMLRRTLVLRAHARSRLGMNQESGADLEKARELDRDNVEVLFPIAHGYIVAGRPADALNVLRESVVSDEPMLLLLRAQAFYATEDLKSARRDLEKSLSLLQEIDNPDEIRLFAAEIALTLGDTSLADRMLESMATDGRAPEIASLIRGRAAFARGDIELGITWLRKAAEAPPQLRIKALSELGRQLLRHRKPVDAARAFEEIEPADRSQIVWQELAAAFMESNQLAHAARLIDEIEPRGPLPEWALLMRADIAHRQGDSVRVIVTLRALAARDPKNRYVQLQLAGRLVAIGEIAAAQTHLDDLIQERDLSASDRMNLAHILERADRFLEAVQIGLIAYRMAPQDPAMHRGFASLIFQHLAPFPRPEVVGANTYVKLVADDEPAREYIIYGDAPIDPLRKEISVQEAERAGFIGKRIGDTVGGGNEAANPARAQWRIAEILPAPVYVFRDIVSHYEERFPGAPFFVAMFNVGNLDSVKAFAPLIAALQNRKAQAELVFQMHRKEVLPLGFIAQTLNVSIAEVMAALTSGPKFPSVLNAEWTDAEGQAESRDAARHAREVVLTRSALESLAELGLLDIVRNAYEWVAPQSLISALKEEIAEAESRAVQGQKTVRTDDGAGLQADEIPPGHPILVAYTNKLRNILRWLEEFARIDVRPLETIPAPGSKEEEVVNAIGNDSFDAVGLAEHRGATMLADDIGLRKFLPKGSPGRSFSIVSLLPTLAERAIISNENCDELLLQLLDRRYVLIVPTRSLLVASVRRAKFDFTKIARVFSLLAADPLSLSDAARLIAEALKAHALSSVQVIDVGILATIALESVSAVRRWPAGLCAYMVLKAAEAELALLPQDLREIRDSVAAFTKRRM